ncbi:MAG: HEAT repeat domain-containing protein [Verrucomicrobiae bacterium]|nr:HEAT repeat domain-containing protein [Verrucomicrobiae bacterium]
MIRKLAQSLILAFLALPVENLQAQDGGSGRTLVSPVEFQTREAYDAEAEVRIANFKLPDGVVARLFADSSQVQNPSAICFDSSGRLHVAEIHRWRAGVQDIRNEQQILLDDIDNQSIADRLAMYERDQTTRPLSFYTEFTDQIVRLEDADGDGRADRRSVFASGFNDVLDGPGIGIIAGNDNSIYYTNIPNLWKLKDSNGDGVSDERVSLQDGFGVRMSISGHDMHGLVWGPDGKLYWSIGDRGYSFTTKEGRHYHRPYSGAVFRCDPDGSNLEEFYTGLRNPQELAFDAFGNLFTCDNNADAWDTGRLVYLIEGGDSGWHHGHQVLMNFRNQLKLRTPNYSHPGHKEIPLNAWTAEALWEPQHEGRPAHALPPIEKVSWGPSGLVYNYGATAMPSRYAGHFWVCNFGGANGDLEAFSVKASGAGFALDRKEVFMVGLGNTDVEFGPDGKMYLSCFNNSGWYKQDLGNIYVLSSKEAESSELLSSTRNLLTSPIDGHDERTLSDLLSHPDLRVRQRAQFELVKRGGKDSLTLAVTQTANRYKRLHGIWALGQLARTDESLVAILGSFLGDQDPEVRAQSARVLADSRFTSAGESLLPLLEDKSSRAKGFAAIGVGKCGIVTALPKLLEILSENDNADTFLRHACVQGMWYLNEREKMLKEAKNESSAIRLGVLLTLRRLSDPRVKYFLSDSDPEIRAEAIRTIHDLDLVTALPDLAREIDRYAVGSPDLIWPSDHRDWMLHTRIINANFRTGSPDRASALLAYAAQPRLPLILREQALLALLEWRRPNPVDAVTGEFRPLAPDSRPDIREPIASGLGAVFDTAEGELLGLATRLALDYGVNAPADLLKAQVLDENAADASRVSSLEGLFRQDAASVAPLWDRLLSSENAVLRSAAVSLLLDHDPARGAAAAIAMVESGKLRLVQAGYHLLGQSTEEESTEYLRKRLAILDKEFPGARLDLVESASKKEDAGIRELLQARESRLDPANPLAAFQFANEGGDPRKGREIFLTHAAGQCSKCHKIDGDGGIAGPDLSGIGSRHEAAYFLESLVAPSASVVPGYGITLVTLKNGDNLGGILMSENDREIILKIPDPADPQRQIERIVSLNEIASRQPPVSAMPPMAALLQKAEIRDLIAYLSSLKEKEGKKGH